MSEAHFPFRGKIEPGKEYFHIVGRFNSQLDKITNGDAGHTFLRNNFGKVVTGVDWDTERENLKNLYFILCVTGKRDEQRVYFSCDPTDAQEDLTTNNMSQGAALVNLTLTQLGLNLNFKNSLDNNGDISSSENRVFSENPENINSNGNNPLNTDFSPSSYDGNNTYNTGIGYFYGIPYTPFLTDNFDTKGITWNFRTLTTILDLEDDQKYFIMDEDNYFKYADTYVIAEEIAAGNFFFSENYLYYQSPTSTGDIITKYKNGSIPKFSGIVYLSNNTTETHEIIFYKSITTITSLPTGWSYGGDVSNVIRITMASRNIRSPNTEYDNTTLPNSIQFQSRKNLNNFVNVNKETLGVSNFMDINMIPTGEGSFLFKNNAGLFAGGKNLKDIYSGSTVSYINPAPTKPYLYEIIQKNNDNNYNKYKPFLNMINMWVAFIQSLDTGDEITAGKKLSEFWTTEGRRGYPRLALNTLTKRTFFTWNEIRSAQQTFMYNYCQNEEVCGDCYGVNKDGKSICYISSRTIKNVKEAASLGGTRFSLLASDENAHKDHNASVSGDRVIHVGISLACGAILSMCIIYLVFNVNFKPSERGKSGNLKIN